MIKIADTTSGIFRGLSGNNSRISVFKGIPFAAPPTGPNRWRRPQPLKKRDGITDAYTFAPIPIQDTPALGTDIYCKEWHVDSEIPMSEDCLYLNVWTGAKSTDAKLPVLVWIFGGAFQWGYTAEMEFCGENIAKRGVVVVSVSYRLGAFGFIAHPEITAENPDSTCNLGMLDQQAGLKWVKDNIKAFGGDPDNITVAGQSAGGASVMSHLVNKESSDIFQKAVIFSGLIRNPYTADEIMIPASLETKEELGVEFFNFLGVKSLAGARELDALYIRDKYAEFAASHPRFVPTVDGTFMKGDPFRLYLEGKHDHKPLLSGNTSDEFTYYNEEGIKVPFIEAATKAALASNSAACEDNSTGQSYYYCFDTDIPGEDNPGNFHSVDLWFWFETLAGCWRPLIGHHYDLSRQMCTYFANFIKNGDPNGNDSDETPLPVWEPYNDKTKKGMNFTPGGCLRSEGNEEFVDKVIEDVLKRNGQK